MNFGKKYLMVVASLWMLLPISAQVITKGKITYERRTNLLKKFNDERMDGMFNEKNKIKTEEFTLFFNDSVSNFAYLPPEAGSDPMSWTTMKNAVFINQVTQHRNVFYDMWGKQLIVNDTLSAREWKITDKTREIAGYTCTRAIWQKNDTTRIYAWFTTDIAPSVGPETIGGLPGAVLGLATEDGGVVYFAKKVEPLTPTPEQLLPPKKKEKEKNAKQLKSELETELKGKPFADRVITELFFWDVIPN